MTLTPKAECVIRAAEIALEEHHRRYLAGTSRAYLKALPDEYKVEARAAANYTLTHGRLPPIIAQIIKAREQAA